MPQLDYYALWSQFIFVFFFLVLYLFYELLIFPILLLRLKVPLYLYQYLLISVNTFVSVRNADLILNTICSLSLNNLLFCSCVSSIYWLHHFICYPVEQLRN